MSSLSSPTHSPYVALALLDFPCTPNPCPSNHLSASQCKDFDSLDIEIKADNAKLDLLAKKQNDSYVKVESLVLELRKITQSLSESGHNTSLEVIDVMTGSPELSEIVKIKQQWLSVNNEANDLVNRADIMRWEIEELVEGLAKKEEHMKYLREGVLIKRRLVWDKIYGDIWDIEQDKTKDLLAHAVLVGQRITDLVEGLASKGERLKLLEKAILGKRQSALNDLWTSIESIDREVRKPSGARIAQRSLGQAGNRRLYSLV